MLVAVLAPAPVVKDGRRGHRDETGLGVAVWISLDLVEESPQTAVLEKRSPGQAS
jgi:hypothetical protein